jgi:prepilin-type N-terminal cleavage/methylation domain-containing protein
MNCLDYKNKMSSKRRVVASRGLSLIEMLLALAISAMLLTATMVALDASFKAYASAAEQASSQAATRMVTHRLVTLIRTSTAHGPLEPDLASTPPVTIDGNTLTSHYIELLDTNDNIVRIEYREASQELWYISTPAAGGAAQIQPLMGGVTSCRFFASRRVNDDGILVLNRATLDLTVQPDPDVTLSLESGNSVAIRVIASTMPRRLD